MDVKNQRTTILKLAAEHGARNVRVFGSVARVEAGPSRDIDFLVDMDADRSLLDLIGLGQDLAEPRMQGRCSHRKKRPPCAPHTHPSRSASAVKDHRVDVGHIRDALTDIEDYAPLGRDAFMDNRLWQDAIIRKLEIIGETVKKLSDATKQRRPEIPWKRLPASGSAHTRLLRR